MSSRFVQLLRRDLALLLRGAQGRGGATLPVLFFAAVAMLFPFAVGPDAQLLGRTGAGVIWIAALLAAILPLDRLIEPDLEAGLFDQWALRGIAEETVLAARILAHWLSFGPPLMLAALPAAALLGLDGAQLRGVELGLLAGAPLWLLDEPLNGLDSASTAVVETLVARHIGEGGIAVIASHQPFALAGMVRLELARFEPRDAR